ncbi:hypothetical protein AB0O01_00880 [Streptomyces sp. NPDC093252]|uniref:hypothetical protein n=1 Tax=Streptomyces sp. NPDC093252 TaxID=3154980 RepID=UPI0034328922
MRGAFSITRHGVDTLRGAEGLLVQRIKDVLGETGDAVEAFRALRVEEIEAALDIQAEKDFGGGGRRAGAGRAKNG